MSFAFVAIVCMKGRKLNVHYTGGRAVRVCACVCVCV